MGITNSYITGLTNVSNGIIGIYPINYIDNLLVLTNPSASFLTIQTKNARTEKYVLTLHTLHGQQIILKNIEFNNSYELNLSNINNGVYFLSLHSEKEQKAWEIVLQK